MILPTRPRKPAPRVRIATDIDPPTADLLHQIATERNTSIAEQVRTAIALLIEHR